MDKTLPSSGAFEPGISIRNGPVQEVDVDIPDRTTNAIGSSKRKSRENGPKKSYAEAGSSEDDDKPLVGTSMFSATTLHHILTVSDPAG